MNSIAPTTSEDSALRRELEAIGPISADSHVTEPATMYVDYIDPQFRDAAPRVVTEEGADYYSVPGHNRLVSVGLVASAGRKPQEIDVKYRRYEDLHAGGWDPKARLEAQERDGIRGEIIYPTIGMMVYGMKDAPLQSACANAYNRWLSEFVGAYPTRLWGIGQTAVRSVDEAVADVLRMKAQGLKGVYLPGAPLTEVDYDHPSFDALWRTCVEIGMPICFHVFTGQRREPPRGQAINMWSGVMRQNQDLIGMFIFAGVFDRHPELKLVCVEADAGWAPHFAYRMDHIYERHRYWQKAPPLKRMPSEYFHENVYMTFQDDWVAFKTIGLMNPERLMWANDFPHADSTWPHSMDLLVEHSACLTADQRRKVVRDNVVRLFALEVD